MTPATLRALLAIRAGGEALVLATRLADGAQLLLPGDPASPTLLEAAEAARAADDSRLATLDGEAWFLHVHAPPWRLIVIGAVHIAQTLAPLATALGFEVTLVDPRRGFASAERFAGAAVVTDWPDTALAALRPDRRTAIVALTHDPKLDDPALDHALHGNAFYLGALGSRKSHAARLLRLAALGHGPAACARIHGPVGLPIGARTTPEIALSILAEIVAVRRGAVIAAREPALAIP